MRQDDSTVRKAMARLQAMVDRDHDHMVATGEDLEWLVHQSLDWPRRVHPDRTTNDRFLRYSMAATLLRALESSPADGDGGAVRAAVIDECARVAENQSADDWFEVGRVVVATGKRIAAAIRSLTPTETGEVG